MLVLSRQRDETIIMGDDIEVTVVDIRGDKVRLGVNAPASVSVHRKEVYDAIRREQRNSPQPAPKPPVAIPSEVSLDVGEDSTNVLVAGTVVATFGRDDDSFEAVSKVLAALGIKVK